MCVCIILEKYIKVDRKYFAQKNIYILKILISNFFAAI